MPHYLDGQLESLEYRLSQGSISHPNLLLQAVICLCSYTDLSLPMSIPYVKTNILDSGFLPLNSDVRPVSFRALILGGTVLAYFHLLRNHQI